ncbi:hypothetical protein YC2023_090852 [Brassica napus]
MLSLHLSMSATVTGEPYHHHQRSSHVAGNGIVPLDVERRQLYPEPSYSVTTITDHQHTTLDLLVTGCEPCCLRTIDADPLTSHIQCDLENVTTKVLMCYN